MIGLDIKNSSVFISPVVLGFLNKWYSGLANQPGSFSWKKVSEVIHLLISSYRPRQEVIQAHFRQAL